MENNLSYYRKEKKLSQEELADKVGFSKSTIGMYEIGERVPPLKKAKKLADFFDVTVEELFFTKTAHDKRANNNSNKAS